ncbi:MAG: S26 family signal peptidase, partial [Oscillospiraceae bacterium]|nr:S26 family signal peptidase [Oscillospiraceae bacterium]
MQTEQAIQKPEEEQYTLGDFAADVLDIVECVASAVFIVIILFTFVVCVARVEGTSMVPTLENDNRLLVSRIGRHYETGDILILNSATAYLFDAEGNLTASPGLDKTIVKRLIAQ